MLARKLQGAGGAGESIDSLDLNYIGHVTPITTTSGNNYTSVTINLSSLSSSVSSQDYWYILGICSRDANGDRYGDFATNAAVTVDGGSTVTAKLIGDQGTASHNNSYSTVGYYAWQSSGTSFSVAVSLADTHEGGVTCTLYEFEHTGSEIYWGDGFLSSNGAGSINVITDTPNFAFSTMASANPSNDRVHVLLATGTSNSAAGTVSNNPYTATWVSDLVDEHGTNEWCRFSRSEVDYNGTLYSWGQNVYNYYSSTTNVHLALTISAA
jgi:hypothetical protein